MVTWKGAWVRAFLVQWIVLELKVRAGILGIHECKGACSATKLQSWSAGDEEQGQAVLLLCVWQCLVVMRVLVKALFLFCVNLCRWLCVFYVRVFASLELVLSFAG